MSSLAKSPINRSCSVILAILGLLVFSGVLTACGGQAPTNTLPAHIEAPPITSVTIIAKDFGFLMPTRVAAGMVDITLINQGTRPHQAAIVRLHDNVPVSRFLAAAQQSEEAAAALITFVGGANTIQPGASQEVLLDLSPGQYMAIGSTTGGGAPYSFSLKATGSAFTVLARPDWNQTPQPADNGTIVIQDSQFIFPPSVKSGTTVLKVSNNGSVVHDLLIARARYGTTGPGTAKNIQQHISVDPLLIVPLGGMSALSPSIFGWLKLNLAPGTYLAMSYVANPTTHVPQVIGGLYTTFIVE